VPEHPRIDPAAADPDHPMILFVALELSRASWLVAIQAPGGEKISRHKLAAGASAELLELVGRQRARTERRTGRTVRVMSCYEAGRDGFWLHRLLTAAGIENLVIDPASVAVNRRARRVKTDRIDVEALLRTMMAHARGERRVCSVVRVPTPEAEDARRLTRERTALLQERVRHVNRVKALCALQGVYGFEPLRPRAAERLEGLLTGDGRPFPERLRAEIRRHLQRLEQVVRQIAEVEALRDEPTSPLATGVARLVALRGLGPNVASILQAEILGRRFANRREIAQYAGLAPSPWASGGTRREQGIGKAGNPRVRAAMIELAWLWLRHQPDSGLSRWFRERVGQARGLVRRIAIVAVARRLLVALWRYAGDGVMPEGAVAKG
jgi:transposase